MGSLFYLPQTSGNLFHAQHHMVALDIKPSAGGLVTHERMTAYIASKGVNELYADSLEALLRAAARHGQS